MHRFRLRKLYISLAVVSAVLALAVTGCPRRQSHQGGNSYSQSAYLPSQPSLSKIKTLRVILQGPFVVLVWSEDHNQIKAYLPKDADGFHEFRNPDSQTRQSGVKQYYFKLSELGLEINPGRLSVDPDFNDFKVTLKHWPPSHPPENYVVLDLPAPDKITYMPPLVGVVFGPKYRVGKLPENHVLEYTVSDGSKVMMLSKLGDKLSTQPPTLDCETRTPQDTGRPCEQSATYYFGVTLSSAWNSQYPPMEFLKKHAIDFFNDKVLPSLFEKSDIEDHKLLSVGDPYSDQHIGSMPMATAAVFRYSQFSRARIINAGFSRPAGPLCLAPAITVTTRGKNPRRQLM